MLTLGRSVEVRPGSKCPYCKHTLTGAAGVANNENSTPVPEPGDFTACINCNNVLVFDRTMGLRKPSYAESREAANNKELQLVRRAIAKMLAAKPPVDKRQGET
jgi:hypothetical protein